MQALHCEPKPLAAEDGQEDSWVETQSQPIMPTQRQPAQAAGGARKQPAHQRAQRGRQASQTAAAAAASETLPEPSFAAALAGKPLFCSNLLRLRARTQSSLVLYRAATRHWLPWAMQRPQVFLEGIASAYAGLLLLTIFAWCRLLELCKQCRVLTPKPYPLPSNVALATATTSCRHFQGCTGGQ